MPPGRTDSRRDSHAVRDATRTSRMSVCRTLPRRSRSPGDSMRAIMHDPGEAERGIRQPGRQFHRHRVRTRQAGQRDVGEVVAEEGEKDRPDIARGAAAFARRSAQRNSHHRQHQARDGQGEAAVQFDARVGAVLRILRSLANECAAARG